MIEIIFIEPGYLEKNNGKYFFSERTLAGYQSYLDYLNSHYPEVYVRIMSNIGVRYISNTENLVEAPLEIESKISEVNPRMHDSDNDVIYYSLLRKDTAWISNQNNSVVYLVENTRKNKVGLTAGQEKGINLRKIRVNLGSWKELIELTVAIRKSAGLQANGPAAFRQYARFSKNAIMFHDHRVREVFEAVPRKTFKQGNDLSIAFSGRLVKIKGAQFIPSISRRIYEKNRNIKIYILGEGEYREKILNTSAPNLIHKGFMDYRNEWEPFVRKNVDLTLLPHIQGDPSMTYYESLGQGVPVIGFQNETLDYLVDSDLAWGIKNRDVDKLVETVIQINENPDVLRHKSTKAIDFMSKHLFEDVVAFRMEHLMKSLKGKG